VCALRTRGLPCLVVVILLGPSAAEARGVITWGDTVSYVGEVSNQHKLGVQAGLGTDVAVGYHYHYWGLFWIDFWTSDGEYCLYRGKSYWPLSPAEAAKLLGQSESDLGKPFLYRFPLGWLLLTAVMAIVVLRLALAKRLKDKIKPLPRDWRYQKALAIMSEQAKRVEAGGGAAREGQATALSGFEVAVQYLTGQGISQAEAEQNLAQLLAVLPGDVHRLLEDERYGRALGTLSEHDERIAPIGFEAAVQDLINQGLSRAEAEHNLALILSYLPVRCRPSEVEGPPDAGFHGN
jgi:hypothetical protein